MESLYDRPAGKAHRRQAQQAALYRAIGHTQRLLDSPAAAADAALRSRWQKRLERQNANYDRLCIK
jgi:hypothetical protein